MQQMDAEFLQQQPNTKPQQSNCECVDYKIRNNQGMAAGQDSGRREILANRYERPPSLNRRGSGLANPNAIRPFNNSAQGRYRNQDMYYGPNPSGGISTSSVKYLLTGQPE